MAQNVGLLDHQQPSTARPRTFIPKDIARQMEQHLVAERLSARLYRLFAPDSVFPQLRPPIQVPRSRPVYEHHLEPKLERLTLSNSPWLQYLHGYVNT